MALLVLQRPAGIELSEAQKFEPRYLKGCHHSPSQAEGSQWKPTAGSANYGQ